MNKEELEDLFVKILFAIITIIFCIGTILFSNWRKNQCLKNNGKVIENKIGIMEKCILGDKE